MKLGHAEGTGSRAAIAEARLALERALGGTARRSEGLALYGRALYLSGDAADAERILIEATATSPVDPEAFQFLADAAERLAHPGIARDALLDLNALEGSTASADVRAARARRIGALSLAKGEVLRKVAESGSSPSEVVDASGLAQISDASSLEPIVRRVVGAHPEIVAEIRAGKDRKFQFLVGQVMKETRGKGDPKLVTELMQAAINS